MTSASTTAEAPIHVELPTDRRITTCRAVAAELVRTPGGVIHVSGARGGGTALALHALARALEPTRTKVVAVTADIESARALAADASFVLGSRDADDAEAAGATTFGSVLLY